MGAVPVPELPAIKSSKCSHGKSREAIPTTRAKNSGQNAHHSRSSWHALICTTCTISRKFPRFWASGHRIHQMSSWQALHCHSSHHGSKTWPKGPSLQEQLRRTTTAKFQSCSDGCTHQLTEVSLHQGLRPSNPPKALMASLVRSFKGPCHPCSTSYLLT